MAFAYIGCPLGFKGKGVLQDSFVPVIFCCVAVLFTQMEESLLLCRLAGYFMPGGDLSSFEARYSFCLERVADVLDIIFSSSLFLLGSVYSRVFFSLVCFVSNFLNCFTVIGFFVILCRICRRLPSGVMCAVPVENVWFCDSYLQELTPLLKN